MFSADIQKFCLLIAAVLLCLVPAPASAILQKGQPAPAFNVVTTSGQTVTLANYKGHVLIMDYFATWCAPCRESIPHLISLNNKYGKQGLQVIGMSVDDEGDKVVKNFIVERKINYPVAIADGELQADYGLRSVPTLYLINKKGIVAEKYQGFSDATGKAMETTIKRLLAE